MLLRQPYLPTNRKINLASHRILAILVSRPIRPERAVMPSRSRSTRYASQELAYSTLKPNPPTEAGQLIRPALKRTEFALKLSRNCRALCSFRCQLPNNQIFKDQIPVTACGRFRESLRVSSRATRSGRGVRLLTVDRRKIGMSESLVNRSQPRISNEFLSRLGSPARPPGGLPRRLRCRGCRASERKE